jgi:3-oxoadipate enol-lactonase
MPIAELPSVRLNYALAGDSSLPAVIFSNSVGSTLAMWEPQVSAFAEQFHVLRYDTRGHGQSSSPPPPYSVEELAADTIALADSLGIGRFHFCGLSLGGMIGMSLALRHPARLKKLVLCNTAAKIGTLEMWNARIETVRGKGMPEIANATPARWFTPAFQASKPDVVASAMRAMIALDPEGYVGGCTAVRDFDARPSVGRIRVPTLVIAGTHDPATPPADGRFLAEHIPGARYVELNAAHISNVEDASGFTSEVLSFLAE